MSSIEVELSTSKLDEWLEQKRLLLPLCDQFRTSVFREDDDLCKHGWSAMNIWQILLWFNHLMQFMWIRFVQLSRNHEDRLYIIEAKLDGLIDRLNQMEQFEKQELVGEAYHRLDIERQINFNDPKHDIETPSFWFPHKHRIRKHRSRSRNSDFKLPDAITD